MSYDKRHGGPCDRGSADAYYRRLYRPHYFKGGTGVGEEITVDLDTLPWKHTMLATKIKSSLESSKTGVDFLSRLSYCINIKQHRG